MTDLPPPHSAPVFGYCAVLPPPLFTHQDLLLVLALFASDSPRLNMRQQRALADLIARLDAQPLLPGKLPPQYRRILRELLNKFAEDTCCQQV